MKSFLINFKLINVTFNGFCLLKICGRENNDVMTQHIKEMNMNIKLSPKFKFSRNDKLFKMQLSIQLCNFK
jgi:hypothetical protein